MLFLVANFTIIDNVLKKRLRLTFFFPLLLCVQSLFAQRSPVLFPAFGKTTAGMPNLVAVDSAYLLKYRDLLFVHPLNYQFILLSPPTDSVKILGHNLADVFIHHDGEQTIDRVVYVLKITDIALIDSLKNNISSQYQFVSMNQKMLLNNAVVESVYFWEYKVNTTVMLIFYTKNELGELFEKYGTELAALTVYRNPMSPLQK